jgi:hypothetical protein
MPKFMITVRSIADGAFAGGLGKVRYLVVPDDAAASPLAQTQADAATASLTAIAWAASASVRRKPPFGRTGSRPLHPWHRHDLDDLHPCAGMLQMRHVLAEHLRRRIG